jgi:hypothetical protein
MPHVSDTTRRATLRPLQGRFQNYLLTGAGTLEDEIVSDGLDARTRLAIYADAYRLRLLEALATDFVALRALLGPGEFERLGRAYLDARPSDHYSLRHFGRHLARFLATAAPWCERTLLAELAAFEWALTEAFDAADAPLATVADLAAVAPVDWPALRFALHPSLQRLELRANAAALWQAADQGRPLPAAQATEHPLGWMVWRRGLQIYFRSLTVEQAWALDALRGGTSFAGLCEGLCEWLDTDAVAGYAAGLLKQWLDDGLISRILTPG